MCTAVQDTSLDEKLDFILNQVPTYLPEFNKQKFLQAFKFAQKAHENQLRKSGEPYIFHPLEAALILTRLHADENTLIAALLHDVPEDTSCSLKEVEKNFGKDISFLVDSITKLSKVYYRHNMEARQIASLKKLLLNTAKDMRVIVIKLADRLHNMRTLTAVPEERKRQRISRETLEIYVPIASLMGMDKISEELQDLCFEHLFPEIFQKMQKKMMEFKEENKRIINETIDLIAKTLNNDNIKNEIRIKTKSLYTIWKQKSQNSTVDPILNDLLSFNIIVDDSSECYHTLGLLHKLFKPKPGQFYDCMVANDSHGHKGLITVVFGLNGSLSELLIQTRNMYLWNRYGILSDTLVNNNALRKDDGTKEKPWWVKRIIDLQKDSKDNESFLEELKMDVFHDRILTFTPKGDLIDLPKGSNVIDFAYAIHTDVGHSAFKAYINNEETSLFIALRDGDTVRVIQDFDQKGPKREWLDLVKTNVAKKRIKEWFKKESRENKIKIGVNIFEKEVLKLGKELNDIVKRSSCKKALNMIGYTDFNDLFVQIAQGSITAKEVLKSIYSFQKSSFERDWGKPIKTESGQTYLILLKIIAQDKMGLVKSVLDPLVDMKINITKISTHTRFLGGEAVIILRIEVKDFDQLSGIFRKLELIKEIKEIKRMLPRQIVWFSFFGVISLLFWATHPFAIWLLSKYDDNVLPIISSLSFVGGFLALFMAGYFLRGLSVKTFPEWKNTKLFSLITFVMLNVIVGTIIAEIIFYDVPIHWALWGVLLLTAYLAFVFDFLKEKEISLTPKGIKQFLNLF